MFANLFMQVTEGNMVRDEYPALEGEENEEEMVQEVVQPQENNRDNADEQMECAEGEEYSNDIRGYHIDDDVCSDIGIKALEAELDHLQVALDHLERKTDYIHAELIDLLQSNRETRKQFQESMQQ